MFNPMFKNPWVAETDYTGVTPEGRAQFNLGDLVPMQQEQGFELPPDYMGTLLDDIATNRRQQDDLRNKRKSAYERIVGLMQQRGGIVPHIAQQRQVDKEAVIMANAIGAIGQAMGLRNGMQTAQNVTSQFQAQANEQTARDQQHLDAQTSQQIAQLEMALKAAGMEYNEITGELEELGSKEARLQTEAGSVTR